MKETIKALSEEVKVLRPLREEVAALRPLRDEITALKAKFDGKYDVMERYKREWDELYGWLWEVKAQHPNGPPFWAIDRLHSVDPEAEAQERREIEAAQVSTTTPEEWERYSQLARELAQ